MIPFRLSHKYSDKWTKTGADIGICCGNNHGNFQLQRFTTRENTAKSFFWGGYFFWLALYCSCQRTLYKLADKLTTLCILQAI